MRNKLDMHHLAQVFCTVVREGSFTAAADALGMKTPSVSKAVSRLEKTLGVTLLLRSTRSMSLSDPGKYYYRESLKVLEQMATIQEVVSNHRVRPMGRLTITASVAVGHYLLAPLIPGFLATHPEITIEVRLSDSILDISSEGIDLAFRSSTRLKDSSLFSQVVSTQKRILVASPAYLDKYGTPTRPEHLENHAALVYRAAKLFDRWSLNKGGRTTTVGVTPKLTANSYQTIIQAARGGVGIANVFYYLARKDLEAGNLVPVLPDFQQEEQKISAIYHQRREFSPKLDAFLSYLEQTGADRKIPKFPN